MHGIGGIFLCALPDVSSAPWRVFRQCRRPSPCRATVCVRRCICHSSFAPPPWRVPTAHAAWPFRPPPPRSADRAGPPGVTPAPSPGTGGKMRPLAGCSADRRGGAGGGKKTPPSQAAAASHAHCFPWTFQALELDFGEKLFWNNGCFARLGWKKIAYRSTTLDGEGSAASTACRAQ